MLFIIGGFELVLIPTELSSFKSDDSSIDVTGESSSAKTIARTTHSPLHLILTELEF